MQHRKQATWGRVKRDDGKFYIASYTPNGDGFDARYFSAQSSTSLSLKNKSGERAHVPATWVWAMKKKSRRYKKLLKINTAARIRVIPTRFNPHETFGNFAAMLKDHEIRKHSVTMFNDNTACFEKAGLFPSAYQRAGGGNAQVRPYECIGHAIGMPTGPFSSLDEIVPIQFPVDLGGKEHTAQEVIDEAYNRVVNLFVQNPNKEVLYYSINPNDPPDSKKIGLAIFAGEVGTDVVNYITDKIQEIPDAVAEARLYGRASGMYTRGV